MAIKLSSIWWTEGSNVWCKAKSLKQPMCEWPGKACMPLQKNVPYTYRHCWHVCDTAADGRASLMSVFWRSTTRSAGEQRGRRAHCDDHHGRTAKPQEPFRGHRWRLTIMLPRTWAWVWGCQQAHKMFPHLYTYLGFTGNISKFNEKVPASNLYFWIKNQLADSENLLKRMSHKTMIEVYCFMYHYVSVNIFVERQGKVFLLLNCIYIKYHHK